MKYGINPLFLFCIVLLALTPVSCNKDKYKLVPNAYSIHDGALLGLDLNAPGNAYGKPLKNLPPGESIVALDYRPANKQLYGLSSNNHLYIIDPGSYVATRIDPAFTPALNGTSFGFDFNPTADRIRVISNTGQNFRLHPVTGEVVATDASITPAGVNLSACAYTNNADGATSTELYAIDANTDKLYKLPSPNIGAAVEVGALGVDVGAVNGFDIVGTDNKAYALLSVANQSKLYTVNLSTGALTYLGMYLFPYQGLAVIP